MGSSETREPGGGSDLVKFEMEATVAGVGAGTYVRVTVLAGAVVVTVTVLAEAVCVTVTASPDAPDAAVEVTVSVTVICG